MFLPYFAASTLSYSWVNEHAYFQKNSKNPNLLKQTFLSLTSA